MASRLRPFPSLSIKRSMTISTLRRRDCTKMRGGMKVFGRYSTVFVSRNSSGSKVMIWSIAAFIRPLQRLTWIECEYAPSSLSSLSASASPCLSSSLSQSQFWRTLVRETRLRSSYYHPEWWRFQVRPALHLRRSALESLAVSHARLPLLGRWRRKIRRNRGERTGPPLC